VLRRRNRDATGLSHTKIDRGTYYIRIDALGVLGVAESGLCGESNVFKPVEELILLPSEEMRGLTGGCEGTYLPMLGN
jgi:hypothetical protein